MVPGNELDRKNKDMPAADTIKRALFNAVTMAMVAALSLFLLIYVGYGEAKHSSQQFQVEKLVAQGRLIQKTMETYLRGGHPIDQFVGFALKAESVLASDASISVICAVDLLGQPIFVTGQPIFVNPLNGSHLLPKTLEIAADGESEIDLRQNERYLQVVLPLRNRFEQVGSLAIGTPRSVINERVSAKFAPLAIAVGIIAAGFGIAVSICAPLLAGKRRRWLQYLYALTFLGVSIYLIATLMTLFAEGAQYKTKALADSLGQRLGSIVQANLSIKDFRGLDRIFSDHKLNNPEISAAGLIVDGIVTMHTNPDAVGRPWIREARSYEYVVNLTPSGERDIRIAVALPSEIVLHQVLRSVKNFIALFVASAIMAGVFLQLAGSVQRAHVNNKLIVASALGWDDGEPDLNFVKPVFFIAVFVEHLMYPFLPQFMYRVAETSGMSPSSASALFMSFYLCFALSLLPAGYFAQQHSPRPLMYGGLLLAALGLVLLSLQDDFMFVLAARAISGVGQGMLFIGVQSYILATAAEDRKTQGASIIVLGFQGGMIAGMAVGSLLVTEIEANGVFLLASAIALVMAVYTLAVVPRFSTRPQPEKTTDRKIRLLVTDLGSTLRNSEFLKTMLLIGIPAKAVLTGVIVFALPILMTQAHYAHEDIGQVLMVYAASVVLSSIRVSRFVDRTGKTHQTLFLGAILSGTGLILVGLIGWEPLALVLQGTAFPTVLLIIGVAVVGIAHGFINAPVVTHIAVSELARAKGASSVTATYRFLERIGHIAGPIIVGQLFLFGAQGPWVIAWFGLGVVFLGLLFFVNSAPAKIWHQK